MAQPAPLSPRQIEQFAQYDCPTISNALELADPKWDRVSGIMAPRMREVFPDMPTVVGCAGTGIGARIAHECVSRFFDWLDGPIATLSGRDIPLPVSKTLEEEGGDA
jgi:hypothetical protein